MRIAEASLRGLARYLDIPTVNASWDSILKKIGPIVSADRNKREARWKSAEEFRRVSDVYERLTAIKGPLRNQTMHVEGFYSPDEAEDIFRSVRRFMVSVSSWLSESGDAVSPADA
jgi:hypothetical protein